MATETANLDLNSTAGLASIAELGDEAGALVQPDLHPYDYVQLLLDKALYPDAVRFLAHALPKREGVWWAWMCARRAAGDNPPPKIKTALESTERWISQPSEENRRAAMAAAEKADFGTPAGCAGLAAFFSGGSLAPPEAPPVPPGEYLTARAVSGAVIFAAVGPEPAKAPEKFKSFVAQALDVTRRIQRWPPKQG
ncbi:MAG TPA: hypothetical protein VGF59_11110 [Bryobacteraceae bacterium]|jgi:hypothetical protein